MERDTETSGQQAGHQIGLQDSVTGMRQEAGSALTPSEEHEGKEATEEVSALEGLERRSLVYLRSLPSLSQGEKQRRLIDLLPFFLQAFAGRSRSRLTVVFPSILPFATEVSKMMVQIMKEKLANKPQEEARFVAEEFLKQPGNVGSSEGWQLLQTLHLLSTADSETLRSMIVLGLPLILLKCVHLFFTFPSVREPEKESHRETIVFQETFTHTLLNLCSQALAVEMMVQSNEVERFIMTVSTLWDQSCPSWRHFAGYTLKAISRTPTKNTVKYLHEVGCVRASNRGLSEMVDRGSVCEAVEAAMSVLCFVKDSYPVSPNLLVDFECADGYQLLTKLLLGCNKEVTKEEGKAVEELVDFISSLAICGQKELKVTPALAGSQFPDFKFEQPIKSDSTVKNLRAFKVLQSVFMKAHSSCLSSTILSSMRKIWSWNRANFFLLEWTQQTLFHFAEVIYLKSHPVQIQYFELLRMVITELTYVPHDVFSRVQVIIRERLSPACALLALECVLDIARHDQLFAVVFRETRLLETLLTQLQRFAKILRKAGNSVPSTELECQRAMSCLMLTIVATMLQDSLKNVVIVREYGMIPYVKVFLDDHFYRGASLVILEQLAIVNAEEYMSIVLGVLCSATQGEVDLKLDLLRSLLNVLEIPKGRTAFRTAGGFNALQTVLADMEGALHDPPLGNWATVEQDNIWGLVHLTLCTLAAAMHSDPVNGYFFATQGQFGKMTDDLRVLGCFGNARGGWGSTAEASEGRKLGELLRAACSSSSEMPPTLRSCVKMYDLLDRMAKGTLSYTSSHRSSRKSSHPNPAEHCGQERESGRPEWTDDLPGGEEETAAQTVVADAEDRFAAGPVIIHPGAICVMVDMLPYLYCGGCPQLVLEFQYAVADYIQSLIRSDQNRQAMCGSGLLDILVNRCEEALSDSNHSVHLPLIRIFEKLTSQAIQPLTLRLFLRLGDPLNCAHGKTQMQGSSLTAQSLASSHKTGSNDTGLKQGRSGSRRNSLVIKNRPMSCYSLLRAPKRVAVPQHRIVSLVSMMSSRNFQPCDLSMAPSFSEFDMSIEGYGCCFLPTVATVIGINVESPIVGGIGAGCRPFPPPGGFTYSIWFLVNKFSSAFDAHPIRCLTIIRHMSKMEKDFICLSISISATDNSLVISTQEEVFEPLDWNDPERLQVSSALTTVEFKCSKYLLVGQWHHLAVAVGKDPRKNSNVIAYLNGKALGTAKMQYIQTFPGCSLSMDPSTVIDIHGVVGTPQIWKQRSSLVWRLGPTHLLEEVISPENVEMIHRLGPDYLGNFQSVLMPDDGATGEPVPVTVVAEEKVSFGINAVSSVVMTVMDIRDNYNEVDSRLISSELGISSRDNAMPIILAKNTASHLAGPSRTIGATFAGFGVRRFESNPAANCLQFVGGPAVILSLVAMASDDHEMYAAVKVLVSALSTSILCQQEMQRIKGYRLLAHLLRRKAHFLNARIFQLILTVVGTIELGHETSKIQNCDAFRDLLCDFEIWLNAPERLDLLLFRHFVDLLQCRNSGANAKVMHRLKLAPKLIFLLNDPLITRSKVDVICTILTNLLKGYLNTTDILRIGLFLAYTLPPASMNEKLISLERISDTSIDVINQVSGRAIWLRNKLLKVLFDIVPSDPLSSKDQENLFLSLGSDWFLLFLQVNLHPATVILGSKLLLHFLCNPALLAKFRDSMAANAWLENSAAECNVLMDNLKSRPQAPSQSSGLIPGLEMVQMFLSHHIDIPCLYALLAALFLRKSLDEVPVDSKSSLKAMLTELMESARLGKHEGPVTSQAQAGLCIEAALVLLAMVRTILSEPIAGADSSWELSYPGDVMHFFCFVYYNDPKEPLWTSAEFVQSLAATCFPTASSLHHKARSAVCLQDSGAVSVETCDAGEMRTHPARKQVSDFIRVLLLDSLVTVPASKHLHPVDLLVEASPQSATGDQRKRFQTQILLFIMDIFHAIDEDENILKVLTDVGPGVSQNASEGRLTTMFGNLSYFSQKLVDKLYTKMLIVDTGKVLGFLTDRIIMVMDQTHPQKDQVMNSLYSSLNRGILHCLSKPRQSPSDLLALLSTLNFLHKQWDVIFATFNSNMAFNVCLIHCLSHIKSGRYPDGFGLDSSCKRAPWSLQASSTGEDYDGFFEAISNQDVQKEIVTTVDSVWNRLLSQRRHLLEDSYKIDLSVKQGSKENIVTISEISPLWEELATKSWQQYITSEKKNMPSKPVTSQSLQSKSDWLTGSLSTAVRSVGKRLMKETDTLTTEEVTVSLNVQRTIGQDMFASLHKEYLQMQQCIQNQAWKDWEKTEQQLLRERGLWGPLSGSQQDAAWILDMAEGPSRMRKKMRPNTFYINYAYDACRNRETESAVMKKHAVGSGNDDFYRRPHEAEEHLAENREKQASAGYSMNLIEENIDERGIDCNELTFFPALIDSLQSEEFFEQCKERQIILQLLDEREKVNMKCSLIVVESQSLVEGVLLFGRDHFYVGENFTLSTSGDLYCVNHHPSSVDDSYIYDMCKKEMNGAIPKCSRYPYGDVMEIRNLRFLLQDIALEIILKNGFSKLLVFHKKDRKKAFKKFSHAMPSLKKGLKESTKTVSGSLNPMVGNKGITQKWQKREINNFQYLMHLNTLAGRTYNDLMQYPIFPWIIADYISEVLDLSNPRTFRDLSKPMGAQTEERKAKFIKRYHEVDHDEELSARCHYCTHYSSAIIVASYLVRMEPFTQTFCSLQGGTFDVADRMFFSVKKEWESASRDNMSDVRELTPEFYYLPEFLLNLNNVEFGSMQDGTTLGDVLLPPWAKGDAREFVRLNREALESDYVSARLHYWIDLIFGYKQQGSAAVDAANVFHPYFYGDQADISNINDPLKKSTVIGFVSNFGQIPKQLFSKAHPARTVQGKHSSGKESVSSLASSQPFFHQLENLKVSPLPVKEVTKGAVGQIVCSEKSMLAVEENKLLLPHDWTKTFSWGHNDFTCCLGNYGSDKVIATFGSLAAWGQCLCATCPDPTTILTGGTNTVVCVWEIPSVKDKVKRLRLMEVLYGHTEAVTCLAASPAYHVAVSGSRDRTCIVWDLNTLRYNTQLPGHEGPLCAVAINNSTGDIASCTGTSLHLWSINGQPLASICPGQEPVAEIRCLCFTELNEWDPRNVIVTGCVDGVLRLWRTEYGKTPEMQANHSNGDPASKQRLASASDINAGGKWEKRLVLCRRLDRNAALSGRANKTKSAITAVAVSRNHSKLFAGDSLGRIYSWSFEG
eukprot:gi/632972759/ref/XP_007902817.1/ PREDICTED: WD repeat- and FYVE domain-containing protein 4 [Callorhinchus milii]